MASFAAHRFHEIPAVGGSRVFHQVEDESSPQVARRLEAERGGVSGQRNVVVDGLGDMCDSKGAASCPCDLIGRERRIVAAYGHQVVYSQVLQRLRCAAANCRIPRGVGS